MSYKDDKLEYIMIEDTKFYYCPDELPINKDTLEVLSEYVGTTDDKVFVAVKDPVLGVYAY